MKLKIKEKTFQAKKEIKKWSCTGKQCGRVANRSVWETCLKLIFTFTILFFTTSGPEITPSTVMPVQIIAFTSKKTKTLKRQSHTRRHILCLSHSSLLAAHMAHSWPCDARFWLKAVSSRFLRKALGAVSTLLLPLHSPLTHKRSERCSQGLISLPQFCLSTQCRTLKFIYLSWHSLTLNTLTLISTHSEAQMCLETHPGTFSNSKIQEKHKPQWHHTRTLRARWSFGVR